MPLSRSQLLDELANLIRDYRHGEEIHIGGRIFKLNSEWVKDWISQFDENVQDKILQEMIATLKETYFSRTRIKKTLRKWCQGVVLREEDPKAFWENVNFLDIQQKGDSQKYILKVLDTIFQEQYGFGIKDCGNKDSKEYVYLDDGIFTGNRIRHDMREWLLAPDNPVKKMDGAEIQVTAIVLVMAKSAEYNLFKNEISNINLKKMARETGVNNITFNSVCIVSDIEDRKRYVIDGDVSNMFRGQWELLRPREPIGDPDVQQWVDSQKRQNPQNNFQGRANIQGRYGPFSSVEGRELLETEFVKAGVRIIAQHQKVEPHLRPLGFRNFDWGFGAMFITHRNCPNNCPLALWWGLEWIPLLPRKPYSKEEA